MLIASGLIALKALQQTLNSLKSSRAVHCKAQGEVTSLSGFRRGAIRPRVVPFQISLDSAQAQFEAWHAEKWLSPRRVLHKAGADMRPVLLPFWFFEAAIKVDYSAQIALHSTDDSKSDEEVVWKDTEWKTIPYREYPWTLSAMQVYGSYNYRRDLTNIVKVPGMLSRARSLTQLEAQTEEAQVGKLGSPVQLNPPSMRQAIAWELALRNIRQTEVADATELLMKNPEVTAVRDVKLRITALRRRARVVYLPAFVVDYKFGTRFNPHGERTPERFQAVMSGMGEGLVAAERHYDSLRAQLTAATAVGAVTGLISLGLAPLLGLNAPSMLSVESAFWAFIVASSAGVAANLAPALLRSYEEDARIQNEQQLHDKYMSGGLGPHHIGNDEQELVRDNWEWQRWESADKWHWDSHKRRLWAENLWRSHHQRRLQRLRLKEYLLLQQEREKWEYEQERIREQRWGRSHFTPHFGGEQQGDPRRDHLGYYEALGLEPGGASLTDIKDAFRQAALMWHPDKQKDSESQRVVAEERFVKLRTAYEILRDPEKRRQYDRGETVEQ